MTERVESSILLPYWLIAYNVISLLGWGYVLVLISFSLIDTLGDLSNTYYACGSVVSLVQLGALIEVIHAYVGAVKTPVATTAMQVASRLFLVAVTYWFDVPEVRLNPAFTSMVLAWSITEVVRYSYYSLSLLNFHSSLLVYARYTFFYVLYPVGASSELWIVIKSLTAAYNAHVGVFAVFCLIAALYPPGFYIMYSHMIKQRKKYISPSASSQKKKKKIF